MVEKGRYVDVNVFIYWLGKHPVYGEKAFDWIQKIENAPPGSYVTSTLTIYEVMVILAGLTGASLNDKAFIDQVINAIINLRGLFIEPLKLEDCIRALYLMENYEIDYEDAIHLSTALRIGAIEIVSNDIDFDKTPLRRIF